jgi:hypothetical protein
MALRISPATPGTPRERGDAHAAGGLAEQRDVVAISAERRDVLADPVDRRDLIEDAEVARSLELGTEHLVEMKEAECTEPVVDGDDDHVTATREVRAAVPRDRSRTGGERTTVDPHHDRSSAIVDRRCEHIEQERVLVHRRRVRLAEHRLETRRVLRQDRPERRGVADVVPRGNGLRPLVPRGCGERDPTELEDGVLLEALNLAGSRRSDRHGATT